MEFTQTGSATHNSEHTRLIRKNVHMNCYYSMINMEEVKPDRVMMCSVLANTIWKSSKEAIMN